MSKQYKVGLFHGRFNHIHLGHQKIIDRMLDECDQSILLIGNCQAQRTDRNPFNVLERIDLIRRIYNNHSNLIIGFFPDLPEVPQTEQEYSKWGDWILEFAKFWLNGQVPDVIYGGDETKLDWLYKNHLDNLRFVKVPRQELPISSTSLKELLQKGKEEEWKESTDLKIHGQYQKLREIIINCLPC